MKKQLILASAILLLLFTSCKSETSSNADDSAKNKFIVTIEAVFAKNDKIQVYYLLDGKWSEENSVYTTVYASDKMQTIAIEFPDGVKPQNIRVDLGVNPTQTNLTLKNISFKFNGFSLDGDNGDFAKYFYLNEYVSWDNDYYGYRLSKINENYDPFLMGNNLLMAKLKQVK